MVDAGEPTDRKKVHIIAATTGGEVWKPLGQNIKCYICNEQAYQLYKTCNIRISCASFRGCGKTVCMNHVNI